MCTLGVGFTLQRLFSVFPDKWPGAGLLLLRIVLGASLIVDVSHGVLPPPQTARVAGQLVAIGVAACLLAGVWTPVTAALQVVIELSTVFSRTGANRMALVLAGVGASVIMLGPGAWSVDARRFGRKRIDIDMG